jgi:succinate dehydrogenase/fumarate reductase cytochrome b subunit
MTLLIAIIALLWNPGMQGFQAGWSITVHGLMGIRQAFRSNFSSNEKLFYRDSREVMKGFSICTPLTLLWLLDTLHLHCSALNEQPSGF